MQFVIKVLIIIFAIISVKLLLFRFKPRKSGTIYSKIIAHRGLHLFAPENSLAAYKAACEANMAIELDVRQTKDGQLVCFHDKYTKRLLNIPGKISMFSLNTLKKCRILDSKEYVPTLRQALELIDCKVDVLIEVKGFVNSQYLSELLKEQELYEDELFFHTQNIYNYFKLRKMFKDSKLCEKRVFFVLNIFRKRFTFVKGKDYRHQIQKYNELVCELDLELPSVDDIFSIIVSKIEELADKKEILATIGEVINRYESRVKINDNEHWVNNSLWLHRGIVSNQYLEHSKESFIGCIKYADDNNISLTIEFDVMLYNGEVRCYHKDAIASFFGQSKSCAKKLELEKTLRFIDILEIVKGHKNINLAIDIKDYHINNRTLEELIIENIKTSKYDGNFIIMSYNPLVLSYFKAVEPDWLRAQIGHSLKGLRKVPFFRFPWIINGILGVLFDMCSADCVVFDDSKWIYYLISYHKNIRGKPVLIYAPKTHIEQEAFIGKDNVSNFIIENVTDENSWPKDYIERFKVNNRIKF